MDAISHPFKDIMLSDTDDLVLTRLIQPLLEEPRRLTTSQLSTYVIPDHDDIDFHVRLQHEPPRLREYSVVLLSMNIEARSDE